MSMPNTYIDLQSLGPDDKIAEQRARLLGLSGTLVPRSVRNGLLSLTEETIICGVQALDYWRILPTGVQLISIEDIGAYDPLTNRFTDRIEWNLVLNGLSRAEAQALIRNPPKTWRHKHATVLDIAWTDNLRRTVLTVELPADLPTISSESDSTIDKPYTVMLVDNEDALTQFLTAILGAGIIGIDVETDPAGEPNEMVDPLVGVGVSIGNDCYFGYANYEPWMGGLRVALANVSIVGWNIKYDISVLRRYGIVAKAIAGDGMLAAYLRGEPSARLKDLVL